MVRFREILRDTIFEDRINLLIDDAKNNWLRDLGKNDFIHSMKLRLMKISLIKLKSFFYYMLFIYMI